MLKLLHTSDWHLGKKLFKKERTEEHEQFLSWLLELLKKEDIDVLLIAGDIFDSPTPPNYALKMYYDFLAEASKLNCKVYIISGNHDSAGLLLSTHSFLKDKEIHVDTTLQSDFSKHCHQVYNKDGSHSVVLKTLPYFRSHEILEWASTDYDLSKLDHEDRISAISNTLKKFLDFWPKETLKEIDSTPRLLMSHHLFGSFIEAGSEQSLSLSGLDSIPVSLLEDFDYVALGHIHKTQYIRKNPPVIYPGSPIAMRFSESNKKSVSLIEVSKDSQKDTSKLSHKLIEIPIFKALIQKRCALEELDEILNQIINDNASTPKMQCYLELIVEMNGPQAGTIDKVRAYLENTNIELLSFIPQYKTSELSQLTSSEIHSYRIDELFEKYYQTKFPEKKMSTQLRQDFKDLIQQIQTENVEAQKENTLEGDNSSEELAK
jgi:exonuclease SbcD